MAGHFELITTEQRDRVLLVTLNRPDKLNAWTPRMMRELVDAVRAANDDPGIGAIVVTGAGRGFCAGADIGGTFGSNVGRAAQEVAALDEEAQRAEREASIRWVELCRSSKPLVAALNGVAIGVGLTLVLPFDQIFAAEGAKLSMRFVKMGLVPELASTHFLVARCGRGAASWLALSGDSVGAGEAARLGLVDRVCTPEALVGEAIAAAGALAANPPTAMRLIKQLLDENGADTDLIAVQRRELAALKQCYASPEHHEAVRAFLDRAARPSR